MCVCVCVCVCVCERERERECVCACVCVCVRERECVLCACACSCLHVCLQQVLKFCCIYVYLFVCNVLCAHNNHVTVNRSLVTTCTYNCTIDQCNHVVIIFLHVHRYVIDKTSVLQMDYHCYVK